MSMNQIVEFFRERSKQLDPQCANITFVNGHHEEIIYDLNSNIDYKYGTIFYDVLATYFPDIDISRVDAISYQQADGDLYSEDKLMISLDGAKRDCFFHPEIGCYDPWQHYCINVGVETRKRSYKFYDVGTTAYDDFKWPDFMIPFDKYGAGVGIRKGVVGMYALSRDHQKVLDFFGVSDPIPESIRDYVLNRTDIHNYGITIDTTTGKLVKLSYFHYNQTMRPDILPYLKDAQDRTKNN